MATFDRVIKIGAFDTQAEVTLPVNEISRLECIRGFPCPGIALDAGAGVPGTLSVLSYAYDTDRVFNFGVPVPLTASVDFTIDYTSDEGDSEEIAVWGGTYDVLAPHAQDVTRFARLEAHGVLAELSREEYSTFLGSPGRTGMPTADVLLNEVLAAIAGYGINIQRGVIDTGGLRLRRENLRNSGLLGFNTLSNRGSHIPPLRAMQAVAYAVGGRLYEDAQGRIAFAARDRFFTAQARTPRYAFSEQGGASGLQCGIEQAYGQPRDSIVNRAVPGDISEVASETATTIDQGSLPQVLAPQGSQVTFSSRYRAISTVRVTIGEFRRLNERVQTRNLANASTAHVWTMAYPGVWTRNINVAVAGIPPAIDGQRGTVRVGSSDSSFLSGLSEQERTDALAAIAAATPTSGWTAYAASVVRTGRTETASARDASASPNELAFEISPTFTEPGQVASGWQVTEAKFSTSQGALEADWTDRPTGVDLVTEDADEYSLTVRFTNTTSQRYWLQRLTVSYLVTRLRGLVTSPVVDHRSVSLYGRRTRRWNPEFYASVKDAQSHAGYVVASYSDPSPAFALTFTDDSDAHRLAMFRVDLFDCVSAYFPSIGIESEDGGPRLMRVYGKRLAIDPDAPGLMTCVLTCADIASFETMGAADARLGRRGTRLAGFVEP